MLPPRQTVARVAQTARLIATAVPIAGLDAEVAMLGQTVGKTVVALQAAVAEHPHLAVTGFKTAQALPRQQLAVHALGQWSGLGLMAVLRVVTWRVIAGGIVARRMLFMDLLDGCGLMSVGIAILFLVVDNLTHNGEAQNGCDNAGRIIFTRTGRDRADRGQCDGSGGDGGNKLAVHVICPFQEECGKIRAFMGSDWMHPLQTGNNTGLLSNIMRCAGAWILNNIRQRRINRVMKHNTLLPLATALLIALALPVQAAGCYADYKAKQDNPLRLHYGVAQINGPCDAASAASELAPRLASRGWTLLNILSVFGEDGLAQRKDSAGSNYLRF